MNIKKSIFRGLGLALIPFVLSACVSSAPSFVSSPLEPEQAPFSEGGLSSLLTGSVVSEEEAQLRDTLKREIVLDFPIRVGVLFYQFDSRLDAPDREMFFEQMRGHLEGSKLVRETLQIPSSLVSRETNLDQLRQIAARFQTDILVLVNANHSFELSRDQNLSFWDSFSEKSFYESKVKYEAIALDVFTGTLLSPFDAAVTGERMLLDFADPNVAQERYAYQRGVEEQAWGMLMDEALQRLDTLAQDVERRQAEANAETNAEANSEENAEENNDA